MQRIKEIKIIVHSKGALGITLFGLGPNSLPVGAITKLQQLLNENTFWARNRTYKSLKSMLRNSSVVISVWDENEIIGFGRATTDQVFRAVLWDIVVARKYQKLGIGKVVLEKLLQSPKIKNVQKIYLMTTNCSDFYKQLDFEIVKNQNLLLLEQ